MRFIKRYSSHCEEQVFFGRGMDENLNQSEGPLPELIALNSDVVDPDQHTPVLLLILEFGHKFCRGQWLYRSSVS